MKEEQAQQDLASIRNLMERSSKFISLSGLSGVLAGIYALVGAVMAYYIIYKGLRLADAPQEYPAHMHVVHDPLQIVPLCGIALAVLTASLATGFFLSLRKARKKRQQLWGPNSKTLLYNMAIPLITGGALMLIFFFRGYYGIVAPASLIFYGLALVGAGNFTYKGVQYLGINEIILGLLAAIYPGYGLYFWAFGFGVLHIVYGSIMYFKYDR